MRLTRSLLVIAFAPAAAALAAAQSNVIPGLDIRLGALGNVSAMSREGVWPNGTSGVAMTTTSCNVGSVHIDWEQAMDPDHPFIAFLIARERGGRMEQISDRSYVKHGFYALTDSLCSQCTISPFTFQGKKLGIGCSDTYSTLNNGDNYWLGPPDEVDPWFGLWNPVCSHFDQGEPAVNPPANCDGNRSLSMGQAADLGDVVGHRIHIDDADVAFPGASTYWYQGQYVVEGEAAALRDDDLGSRQIFPGWNGQDVTFSTAGQLLHGSILQRWSGVAVIEGSAGADNGSFYLARKITGPVNGIYHYEYAVHNRDNSRAGGALRIPICSGAQVLNAGFKDVDGDSANDWALVNTGTELVFSTASNPVRWNSFYNFWFDSDAAPSAGTLNVDHFSPGAGPASVAFQSSAPLALYNVYLGPGCATGAAPGLHATGAPAQATLGNASFGLEATGLDPLSPALLFIGVVNGDLDLGGGCHLYMGGLVGPDIWMLASGSSNAGGTAAFAAPIPSNPGMEGSAANFQVVGLPSGGGPVFGVAELSSGLRVRVGNLLPGCP